MNLKKELDTLIRNKTNSPALAIKTTKHARRGEYSLVWYGATRLNNFSKQEPGALPSTKNMKIMNISSRLNVQMDENSSPRLRSDNILRKNIPSW